MHALDRRMIEEFGGPDVMDATSRPPGF